MNGRRNKSRSRDEQKVEKKVIRCEFHHKPVFMNDTCSNFLAKTASGDEHTCKNCQYSF